MRTSDDDGEHKGGIYSKFLKGVKRLGSKDKLPLEIPDTSDEAIVRTDPV